MLVTPPFWPLYFMLGLAALMVFASVYVFVNRTLVQPVTPRARKLMAWAERQGYSYVRQTNAPASFWDLMSGNSIYGKIWEDYKASTPDSDPLKMKMLRPARPEQFAHYEEFRLAHPLNSDSPEKQLGEKWDSLFHFVGLTGFIATSEFEGSVAHIVEGQRGDSDFVCFDYRHSLGDDEKIERTDVSAVACAIGYPVQPLYICPQDASKGKAPFLNTGDIDFESIEFNEQFYIAGHDKRWAYDVVHPRTMEFLQQHPGYRFTFTTEYVLVNRTSLFNPEEFDAAIEIMIEFVGLFPDHLKHS